MSAQVGGMLGDEVMLSEQGLEDIKKENEDLKKRIEELEDDVKKEEEKTRVEENLALEAEKKMEEAAQRVEQAKANLESSQKAGAGGARGRSLRARRVAGGRLPPRTHPHPAHTDRAGGGAGHAPRTAVQ